ncbi:HNH endonuclease [Haliangium sp.]|uniref:HNH endonuclease n=1 Tax=Haliangium sp. TaxID=2663208 RepID=UPI003D131FC1
MSRTKRRQILAIVATDCTFDLTTTPQGEQVWVGKCIHCNRRLVISAEGEPLGRASIEHIVPRHHGGTDELENLALACDGCNTEKGVRHDIRKAGDPKLREIVDRLQVRRRERWRERSPG